MNKMRYKVFDNDFGCYYYEDASFEDVKDLAIRRCEEQEVENKQQLEWLKRSEDICEIADYLLIFNYEVERK